MAQQTNVNLETAAVSDCPFVILVTVQEAAGTLGLGVGIGSDFWIKYNIN
jgi:hypothetical protein